MTKKHYKKKENGKNATGRPEIVFTERQWIEFEQLCAFQCTEVEVCEWFGIDHKTLDRLLKEKYDESFSQVFRQKRIKGLISLRRYQFQLAQRNPAMAIFLGKNYLDQTDKKELDANLHGDINFIEDVRE